MVRELVHDPILLARVSEPAAKEDWAIAQDLLETLIYHKEGCVGMAANMIGVTKRIIAFNNEGNYEVMLNPQNVKSSDEFDTREGCLSLLGDPRPTKRFRKIKVQYQTLDMKVRLKTYQGFTAQIIQHEIDHCNGILI
jgi:peptide deformylase